MFGLSKNNNPFVGVSLGGNNLLAGRIENKVLKATFAKEIDNRESEEFIINEVIRAIDSVINDEVVGIGVGVPSVVDVEQGIVYNTVKIPSWREVYLKNILEERFGITVKLNNDANCFIIGEWYFGKAKKTGNSVGLILGVGMGCGILIEGRLYSGTSCVAGEFGSIPYKDFDYEYYCATGYFVEKYGVKYDVLLSRAKDNDKIALAIWELYGFDVGNAIKTILFSLAPEMIILGGALAEAFPYFEASMLKTVNSFPYKRLLDKLTITYNADPFMPVMGAAALLYSK